MRIRVPRRSSPTITRSRYIARLRTLCGEKGFAFEATPGGRALRLIDVEIGHRLRGSFSVKEATIYLKELDREQG